MVKHEVKNYDMRKIEEIFLFCVLMIVFYTFDVHADETAGVICNSIRYIHGMGDPLFTVIIIGASLIAIFGRMSWPALFSLGMFVAVFFGAPQIANKITEKEICCLYKGQTLEDGKCVAAPGYDHVGTSYACANGKWMTEEVKMVLL